MGHYSSSKVLKILSTHHPLVIEGMGKHDIRDPISVASIIHEELRKHWERAPPQKPLILVTQGDSYEDRGISAITRTMSDHLDISRILVYLDPSIAAYHAPNADRYNVSHEIPFSSLLDELENANEHIVQMITQLVDEYLQHKTAKRLNAGKEKFPEYYRDFALLQEITKVACKTVCGDLTLAHTSGELHEYSISSFYRVGLDLGLIDSSQIVPFPTL